MLVVTPTERPHQWLLAPVLFVPASRTRWYVIVLASLL
jgi:hypothetical protein